METPLHFIAVLKLPGRIGDQIIKFQFIHEELDGNIWFPSPVPTLATYLANINDLIAKETAAKTKTPGAVAARDAALKVVVGNTHSLMAYVQSIADNNTTDAETIIKSGGFDVKKVGQIDKQDFTVKNGEVSGTVILTAKGINDEDGAHQWGISPDGNDWNLLALLIPPTLAAHTEVSGLTRKSEYFFRHREILRGGPGGWSETISIVIT